MRLSWLKFTKFAVIALVAAGAKTAHAYNLSPISFANFYQIAAEPRLWWAEALPPAWSRQSDLAAEEAEAKAAPMIPATRPLAP